MQTYVSNISIPKDANYIEVTVHFLKSENKCISENGKMIDMLEVIVFLDLDQNMTFKEIIHKAILKALKLTSEITRNNNG